MKKVLKLTLAVALMLGSTSLFAQKFGRVNIQEIVVSMPDIKQAQSNIEAFQKDLIATYETMQVDYNNKVNDLQKNEATYTDSKKQLKYNELQDLSTRMQQFQEAASRELQSKQAEQMEPIYKKVEDAVNKIAKAGGYIAIFNTSPATNPMAYFDEAQMVDLAAEVKSELGIPATAPAPAM